VPSTGGSAIGESEIEQQRVEPGRGDGAGESGQPAAGGSQRVAGVESSADQAAVGAVSRGRSESVAAWQLGRELEADALCCFRYISAPTRETPDAVADVARARKLYEEKVGLKVKEEYAGGVIYECGKGSWAFMYPSPGAGTSKASTAFWAVDDVAAEVAELKEGPGVRGI
jgi:hypothetical protein